MFPSVDDVRAVVGLVACLDSVPGDYVARQKIGGTHLKYNVFKQLAVLPPSAFLTADLAFIVPRVLELTYTSRSMVPFARDLGYDGPPFRWDEDRRALLRAELDAYIARLYGFTREELYYILDPAAVLGSAHPTETFRVLKENEVRKYGEYRTSKLVLEAWDQLERGKTHVRSPPIVVATPASHSVDFLLCRMGRGRHLQAAMSAQKHSRRLRRPSRRFLDRRRSIWHGARPSMLSNHVY
jgi:hypothetical protein